MSAAQFRLAVHVDPTPSAVIELGPVQGGPADNALVCLRPSGGSHGANGDDHLLGRGLEVGPREPVGVVEVIGDHHVLEVYPPGGVVGLLSVILDVLFRIRALRGDAVEDRIHGN